MRTVLQVLFVARVSGALVPLRPPCTPLNVVSPYQSTWSCSDNLFDSWPQHWNGADVGMFGIVKVDGSVFRFMGPASCGINTVVAQKQVTVEPTTTTYQFETSGIALEVSFVTPAIGLDSDIVSASRPITYTTFKVSSIDGQEHSVQLYYDNSAEGAVQHTSETVSWSRLNTNSPLTVMQIGASVQKFLGQGSDQINWGQWLVATPTVKGLHTSMNAYRTCRDSFVKGTYFSLIDDTSGPRPANNNWPLLSIGWDLGMVSYITPAERHMTLAYDQVLSQRYFGTDMPPLWRNTWFGPESLLTAVEVAREADLKACTKFNNELIANLTLAGGDKYATLGSLVYRQVVGATQAVWNPVKKEAWTFMKEISSDGDVSTVDVIYPAFPMFQYLYPEYFRRTIVPILVYGNNETKQYGMDMPYNLEWAPHHLGHWPICDLKPSAQEQMPVEESGNMLIMLAALYKEQQSLDYLAPYWPMLNSWADYIVGSLPDPGNQLCTDDFEGPSPHNTNLAVKGIVALEAYAGLLSAKGDKNKAADYAQKASAFANNWTATAGDGDHYRIQFNLPSTWSQKYNLLYQKILGLKSFPDLVFQEESKYYATKMETCGVPLDSRHKFAKSDWSLWAASFATTTDQFEAIVNAVFKLADTTPTRVPLGDWYDTTTCEMKGFRARPVQGGFFAKMLVPPVQETFFV